MMFLLFFFSYFSFFSFITFVGWFIYSFGSHSKGFLHLLKLGLTPSKKKASKLSERKLSTVIHSPPPATAGTNKDKQPESYVNALIKEKSSLSYSSSSHQSPSHSSPSTDEIVTPRRRVFQRQASHSSLAHMMMTPHEVDRSQDINLDISLDVSHDISHEYNDDDELHHDDDLDIERHRFLKSFNRNKFARGASREVHFLLDLDVHNEEDSFHYDGKVLEFVSDD